MFEDAANFKQDLSNWKLPSNAIMFGTFTGSSLENNPPVWYN